VALEYNQAIDAAISAQLRMRGQAHLHDISGATDVEAVRMLETYLQVHGREVALDFDGRVLRYRVVRDDATPAPGASDVTPLSPVEQVLAAQSGSALLDAPRSEAGASKLLWLLPLAFALPGGIIAWAITREQSPRTARNLFWAGVVVSIVSICLSAALAPQMGALLGGQPTSRGTGVSGSSWPASSSGRSTFYYFGTTT
jgi:hypothetical protein